MTAIPFPVTAPTGGAPRRGSFLSLSALIVVLNLVGLMMVLSASSVHALAEYGDSWMFFKRQLLWVALGTVLLVASARIDYRFWRRASVPLMAITIILLMLVLIPGVGIKVSGSTRWLGFGSIRMQPSELAKFAVLVFCSDLLARRASYTGHLRMTLQPVLIAFGAIAFLVMLQPDMGTTVVTATIAYSLLFAAGTPLSAMVGLIATAGVAGLGAAMAAPYRMRRLSSFLDPFADSSGSGWQTVQSFVGIGSGGIAGLGLGESRSKWGFLPNAHTDFIYAVIAEELGLIGALLVLMMFVALAIFGVRAGMQAPDRFGTLMAVGITAWLIGQTVINIGAVIGLLPVTGVPLPFVSFGGSSLLIVMAASGVLLNIARQGRPAGASGA